MQKYKFTLGALVIAAGLGFLLVRGFEEPTATHLTLNTLSQKIGTNTWDDQRIQLGGSTVVPGSIKWDKYRHRPEFSITDGQHTLQVRYTGNAVLPDTFRDESQVVLEGRYNSAHSLFEAQVVFAKCPSKYEGQSYEGHVQAMQAGKADS